jgi:hypothetical protein
VVTDFDATINPNGGNPTNEALGSGRFTVEKQIELPLKGLAFNFFVQDTFDFSFGPDADKIKSALIRIATINSFPVDAKLQLFFTDNSFNVLDSLIYSGDQKIISAASVDATGKSNSTTTKTNDYPMESSRFLKLKNGTKIILRANIATSDNGGKAIRIYSTDFLDIKLGMQVKYAFGELK